MRVATRGLLVGLALGLGSPFITWLVILAVVFLLALFLVSPISPEIAIDPEATS